MNKAIIYTDGSYTDVNQPKVGWAYVIIDDNENIISEDCGVLTDYGITHRNVTGELKAVMQARVSCEKNGINEVDLYHDYTGVRAWCVPKEEGGWKAKNEITITYQSFMKDIPVKVNFHHVKGHSGDKWNEYVDKLAKAKF